MIYGYMHCYLTTKGIKIYSEQLDSIVRSGLYSNTERLSICSILVDTINHPSYDALTKVVYRSTIMNHFEGFTLNQLWLDAMSMDDTDLLWYIHTKGATSNSDDFRNEMENVVISHWQECINSIQQHPYDIYCAHQFPPYSNVFFVPGNFWWTTAKHIKSLPSPAEWVVRSNRRNTKLERYAYEDWLTLSAPTRPSLFGPTTLDPSIVDA